MRSLGRWNSLLIVFLIVVLVGVLSFLPQQTKKQFIESTPSSSPVGQREESTEIPSPEKILEVNLNYDESATPPLTIISVTIKNGYSPKHSLQDKGYKLQLLDRQNKLVSSLTFIVPNKIGGIPPPIKGQEVKYIDPKDLILKKVNFTLALPFFETAVSLQILDPQGNIIATRNLPNAQSNLLDYLFSKAYAQNTRKKFYITFISNGYADKDRQEFNNDVNRFKNNLLTYEPFKTRASQIVFNTVFNPKNDLNCTRNPTIPLLILCDFQRAQKVVKENKPYTKIFIISKSSLSLRGGGSAISGIVGVADNGIDGPQVFVHELGHLLGLLDENVIYEGDGDGTTSQLANNCYTGKYEGSLLEEGPTYQGCSYSNWYRFSETSIMKDLGSREFNLVSQSVINESLDYFAEPYSTPTSTPTPTPTRAPSPTRTPTPTPTPTPSCSNYRNCQSCISARQTGGPTCGWGQTEIGGSVLPESCIPGGPVCPSGYTNWNWNNCETNVCNPAEIPPRATPLQRPAPRAEFQPNCTVTFDWKQALTYQGGPPYTLKPNQYNPVLLETVDNINQTQYVFEEVSPGVYYTEVCNTPGEGRGNPSCTNIVASAKCPLSTPPPSPSPTPSPIPTAYQEGVDTLPTPIPDSFEPPGYFAATPTTVPTSPSLEKKVVGITINGLPVDLNNPLFDLRLPGTEGKNDTFLIPVIIAYSDGTTKEIALVFDYKPVFLTPAPTSFSIPPPTSTPISTRPSSCDSLNDPATCNRTTGCIWEAIPPELGVGGGYCKSQSTLLVSPSPTPSVLKRTTWFCGQVEYAACENNSSFLTQDKTKECCYEGKASCIRPDQACGAPTPTPTRTPTPTPISSFNCSSPSYAECVKNNNCIWEVSPDFGGYCTIRPTPTPTIRSKVRIE